MVSSDVSPPLSLSLHRQDHHSTTAMKRTITILLSSLFLSSLGLSAQDTPHTPLVRKGTLPIKRREKQTEVQASQELSHRAKELLTSDTIPSDQIAWRRGIYRALDLMLPANAPLYTPEIATAQRGNLFTQLFRLYAAGKIPVYEYLDGVEQLDATHLLSFSDFLDRFHISYTEGKEQGIPSSDVKAYYIKEAHLFDEGTASYATQVEALCPILTSVGDYGEVRLPLFWVRYSDVVPYLQNSSLISLSEENSAYQGTLFDFFRLGLYKGEIIKTENLRGLTLLQEYKTTEEQKKAQERIERELSDFQGHLYLPDSTLHRSKPTIKKGSKGKARGKSTPISSSRQTSSSPLVMRSARGRGY